MYAQVEKPKEKKSRAVANSVTQKMTNNGENPMFIDNRMEAVSQRNIRTLADNYSSNHEEPVLNKENYTNLPANANRRKRSAILPQNFPIQFIKPNDLKEMGESMQKIKFKEAAGVLSTHMWKLLLPNYATVVIVGTVHSYSMIQDMAVKQKGIYEKDNAEDFTPAEEMLNYISKTKFSKVYTEIKMALPSLEKVKEPLELLEKPDRSEKNLFSKYIKRIQAGHGMSEAGMDETLARLALKSDDTNYKSLETKETREQADNDNYHDSGGDKDTAPIGWGARLSKIANEELIESYKTGNERKLWKIHATELEKGLDPQGIEARNTQWIEKLKTEVDNYDTASPTLWIVGASHIPGLLMRCKSLKWDFGKFSGN